MNNTIAEKIKYWEERLKTIEGFLKKERLSDTLRDEYLCKQGLYNDFLSDLKELQQEPKGLRWSDQDIIDAWNSAYGGDSHHDGEDYLKAATPAPSEEAAQNINH